MLESVGVLEADKDLVEENVFCEAVAVGEPVEDNVSNVGETDGETVVV